MTTHPFASAVTSYLDAGWTCVFPVPVADKYPPPVGVTGADGRDPDRAQIDAWIRTHGSWSIAIRLPDGVIGIDVDQYDKVKSDGSVVKKRGAEQLTALEEKLGPLPPTWISTARQPPSGVRLYRVPEGSYRTSLGDSIEVIQRHHRYIVVAPSWHAGAEAPYRWWSPDGLVVDKVPFVDELPWLTDAG